MLKSRFISYAIILSAAVITAIIIHFPDKLVKIIGITKYADANNYEQVFSYKYAKKIWRTGSGEGSIPENAKPYIALLQQFFEDPKYTRIIDLGCGDWQMMQHINIPAGKTYIGVDVVPPIITSLQKQYGKSNVRFINIASLFDFAQPEFDGDLLIVKDVLQHWPNVEIKYFLENILPRYKYALITNDAWQDAGLNTDIKLGGFRPLDLAQSPYNVQNLNTVLAYEGPAHKVVSLYVNPKLTAEFGNQKSPS